MAFGKSDESEEVGNQDLEDDLQTRDEGSGGWVEYRKRTSREMRARRRNMKNAEKEWKTRGLDN